MKPLYLFLAFGLTGSAQSAYLPYIEEGLKVSPSVKAVENRDKAEILNARAEGDAPGLEAEFEYLWNDTNKGENRWNAGVSEEILWPRSNAWAQSLESLSALNLKQAQLEAALSIKLAILDYIHAYNQLELYTEIHNNLERINIATEKAYEAGEATILDFKKSALAHAQSDAAVANAESALNQARASLDYYGVEMPQNVVPQYPLQELTPATNDLSQLAHARNITALARAKFLKADIFPSFSLGYRHAYEDGQHFDGFSVGIKLGSPSALKRREAAELEARAIAFDAGAEQKLAKTQNDAYFEDAQRLASTLTALAPMVADQSYLELLNKAYEKGQLSIIEYYTEVNLFTQARLDYLDTLYRYNETLARLHRFDSIDF